MVLTVSTRSLLHTGHLPPKPIPRLPPTQIRPLPFPRRRPGRRSNHPAHKTGRRVPTLYPTITRIQVLALQHAGNSIRLPSDLVRDIQRACFLAGVGGVFHYPVQPDEYVYPLSLVLALVLLGQQME